MTCLEFLHAHHATPVWWEFMSAAFRDRPTSDLSRAGSPHSWSNLNTHRLRALDVLRLRDWRKSTWQGWSKLTIAGQIFSRFFAAGSGTLQERIGANPRSETRRLREYTASFSESPARQRSVLRAIFQSPHPGLQSRPHRTLRAISISFSAIRRNTRSLSSGLLPASLSVPIRTFLLPMRYSADAVSDRRSAADLI